MNITIRNFAGGLLGGFLGIMAAGLIHPLAIPFACVFGVLVGFYFKEIKGAIINRSLGIVKVLKAEIDTKIVLVSIKSMLTGLRRWLRYYRLTLMRGVRDVNRLFYWCLSCLGWVVSAPFMLGKFLLGHPVAIARTIRALSIVCATIVVLIISYHVFPDADEAGRYMLAFFLSVISVFCSFLLAEGILEGSDQASFYRSWSRYSRRGPILHAVMSVAQHYLAMIFMCVAFSVGLAVVFGGVVALLLLFGIYTLMNALWIVSSRHEHILCVTVTLVTTIVSAIVFSSYMHDLWLWCLALSTGVSCGLLSELTRRLMVYMFNNTVLYKFLGEDVFEESRHDALKFGVTKWTVWRKLGNVADFICYQFQRAIMM